MLSDEVHSRQSNTARRGGATMAGVALALFMAACGSEAENTGSSAPDSASTAGQSTSEATAAKSETAANENAAQSSGDSDTTMVADSSDASDSGGEKAATEEKKEQKREPMDGYTVYNRFCVTCHRTGLNAAPKFREKKLWAPRIAKGRETLYKHSIEGFKGMPPKGGIAGLYDQEVRDAVDFMVENAGGWDSAE